MLVRGSWEHARQRPARLPTSQRSAGLWERGSHACAGRSPPVIFDPIPRQIRGRSLIDRVVFSCRSESTAEGHQKDREGCTLLPPTA